MFRFTIRDVLWLTVVVALAFGWWLDRSRLSEQLAHDQRVIGALKLLDERWPNWPDEFAGYLKSLTTDEK